MPVEELDGTDKFIDDFNLSNPVGSTDTKATLDDHIRGIKNVLNNCFEFITGKVTATHTELNKLDGCTVSTAELNTLSGVTTTPVQTGAASTKSAGNLTFNDNVKVLLGTSGGEGELSSNGTDVLLNLVAAAKDFFIQSVGVSKFWFDGSTGDFHADGDIYAFSTSVGSDPKLKDDVQRLESVFKKLHQIRGYSWKWKKNGEPSAGVLSTEVKQALPEAVSIQEMNGESYEVVNYNCLVGLLIEAVNTQEAQIRRLSRRVTQLELLEADRRLEDEGGASE